MKTWTLELWEPPQWHYYWCMRGYTCVEEVEADRDKYAALGYRWRITETTHEVLGLGGGR